MTDRPRLVFGDDGSASSDLAWRWINAQTWPGWQADVVTAQMPPIGPPPPAEEARLHPWQPPDPRRPMEGAAFAEVRFLTARLDPRVALLEPADLVVIGPRGRGLLKSLHIGSTAEWLLQHPPAPTVVVRAGDTVRSVLAAHDGSVHAQAALDALAALPWISTTDCTVVIVDDGRVDVGAAAEAARRALGASGVQARIVVAQGHPTAAISGEIDRRTPDLVALGTRGLTGLRRRHVGSTSGALTRAAHCSVLIASADAETDRD
jgi:nucleotide-binding universal stress UspA family protein